MLTSPVGCRPLLSIVSTPNDAFFFPLSRVRDAAPRKSRSRSLQFISGLRDLAKVAVGFRKLPLSFEFPDSSVSRGEENPRVPYLIVFLFRRITGCVQRGYLRGSSRAKVEDPIKRRGTCFEIKILYGIGSIYDESISKDIYYREEKRARSVLIFDVYRLTNRPCFRGVIERGIMGAVNVSAFGNCKCPQELFLIDVDSMWRHLFNNQVALQQTIMIDDRTPHYFNAIINRDDEFSLKLFSIWHQCYTGTISDENETLSVKSSIDSLFPATILFPILSN